LRGPFRRLSFAGPLRYGPPRLFLSPASIDMAEAMTPHFHNSEGLARIEVGSKEFMCIGALPPHDHPHIYLDMGKEDEIVCAYCSTLYVFNRELAPGTSQPLSAVYHAEAA
jgi:uncharacterized Zn-finger protein